MNSFNRRIAALVGLGLLSSGCAAESIEDETLDVPPLQTLDGPTGNGTNNGLPADLFQGSRAQLVAFMSVPLVVNGALNPVLTSFATNVDTKRVFSYAVECALPVGTFAGEFAGAGLMTTAGGWLNGGLAEWQMNDVLTCITARLNPSGTKVEIWMGGPDTGKSDDAKPWPYFEALWRTEIGIDGMVFKVWPSDTFLLDSSCKTLISEIQRDFNTRICDTMPSKCGVALQLNMASNCTGTPGAGDWICDGEPVIETRLGVDSKWNQLNKCLIGPPVDPSYKTVCGRGAAGITCARTNGMTFEGAGVWQPAFSDVNGWNGGPQYYSTIQYPDLDADGNPDVCGRGAGGINCALSPTGTTMGAVSVWHAAFSDGNGWNGGPQYYSTIRYPDLNGDGKADLCGRGGGGINCALSNGTTFGAVSVWQPAFSDGNGWNGGPQYYSTIQFADVNHDGKADVCGRGGLGIYCALSTGTGFGPVSLWSSFFSDGNGWNVGPQYYSTIQFADVNHDGKADVCGRGPAGVYCALSNGVSFGAATLWQSAFSDVNGWNVDPEYYSTIHFADLDADGFADVCGRGPSGVGCALSNGAGFGAVSLWSARFSDANGWKNISFYSTLQLVDINHDGKADLCGRDGAGINCVRSVGNGFGATDLVQPTFSDAGNWAAGPQYYSTIRFGAR